jgi:hypothetical protein
MAFEQDWMLRQIDMMIQFVARSLLKKDLPKDESSYVELEKQSDKLHNQIDELIEDCKFCEAEDLLYESLDFSDISSLRLAMEFYEKLNSFSDEELESNNFSREEIGEGLDEILSRYGLDFNFDA